MTSVTSSNLGHFKASSSESPFPALPVALGPGSLYTAWQQRVEALASMPASSPLASAGPEPCPAFGHALAFAAGAVVSATASDRELVTCSVSPSRPQATSVSETHSALRARALGVWGPPRACGSGAAPQVLSVPEHTPGARYALCLSWRGEAVRLPEVQMGSRHGLLCFQMFILSSPATGGGRGAAGTFSGTQASPSPRCLPFRSSPDFSPAPEVISSHAEESSRTSCLWVSRPRVNLSSGSWFLFLSLLPLGSLALSLWLAVSS